MFDTSYLLDSVELPFPPSVNHYWKTGRTRQGKPMRYKSREANIFMRAVELLCGRRTPSAARLACKVEIYPPDNHRRDVDNLAKGVLDSLTVAGVMLDDSQIDDLHLIRRGVHKPGGKIIVWVWEIDNGR